MDLYGKSHYIPHFTRKNDQGEQETACRLFVPASQVAPLGKRPSCWGCAAWLDGLELDARGDARELRTA